MRVKNFQKFLPIGVFRPCLGGRGDVVSRLMIRITGDIKRAIGTINLLTKGFSRQIFLQLLVRRMAMKQHLVLWNSPTMGGCKKPLKLGFGVRGLGFRATEFIIPSR